MVELADAPDSKSGDGDIMRVQVPPSAPNKNKTNPRDNLEFVFFVYIILRKQIAIELNIANKLSQKIKAFSFIKLYLYFRVRTLLFVNFSLCSIQRD